MCDGQCERKMRESASEKESDRECERKRIEKSKRESECCVHS